MKNLFYTLLVILIVENTNAQSISTGRYHSLAICSDQTVRSWGSNIYGQLGHGTFVDEHTAAVQVIGLSGIIAVVAGGDHSLFLKDDSTVWASGWNHIGQLGDGAGGPNTYAPIPVQVSGLTGIKAIAAGWTHSLFLKNDGTVWGCGDNGYGELGDGTTINKYTPVQVNGLSGITAIAAGLYGHSLFLKNDGTVWACGNNDYGQLGDGTITNKYTAVQVNGLSGITAIAANGSHTIFLKNDSTVWACGYNLFGQLGDGTNNDKMTPVQMSGLSGVTTIAAGSQHSLFLKSNGTLWGCGLNFYGQLGDGTLIDKITPVQLNGFSGITAISGGAFYSLFLKNDGIWGCGMNNYGQLGDGNATATYMTTPVQVINLCNVNSTGTDEIYLQDAFTIYPTISNDGNFIIAGTGIADEISVFNITGQKIISKEKVFLPFEFLIPSANGGIFVVHVKAGNAIKNEKIIVAK